MFTELELPTERRRYVRRVVNVPAQLRMGSAVVLAVRLLDIGEGGAGIVAPSNPQPGVRCLLRFALPASGLQPPQHHELVATVANSVFSNDRGGFKLGLAFVDVSDNARQALRAFVDA